MKKVLKVVGLIILPALIVIIAIVLSVMPYFATKYVNEHGKEFTGRKIALNEIRFNYLTTTLNVIGFKMFETDEQRPFVTFDTLRIKFKPFRLISSELNIEQIRLVKPEVNIVRKDTVFNFSDIITFIKSKPKTQKEEKNPAPLKYIFRNITLDSGKISFNDAAANYTSVMKDLGFAIPYISYNQEEISQVGLKFHFENGGFFQAKADYNQKLGLFGADFTVKQLDIAPFIPYTKDYFRLKSIEGLAEGEFHISGNIGKPDSLLISGNGNLIDFSAIDPSGIKVLGLKNGHVVMNQTLPMKFAFNFDTISLTEPFLFFEMKDSTNNILKLMVPGGTSDEPFSYSYKIRNFEINKGIVDFRDNTHVEPFNYHVDQLSLKLDSISSTSKWINTYASARLNNHGKLKMELGIDPSNPFELKINSVLTNFMLTDLNIYSKYYVGFPIILGNMYYQSKTSITAKQLNSENKLIIRNVKLGKKSGGLMNIPLKLAIYLLTDIHGDITLDIPLTGDLKDPKTNISRLVWQTLKNVVVKIVASPFLALSHLMGVDPTEVKGIEFNYCDTTLVSSHLRRIRLFTELEKKKPDMKIELASYNDTELEKKEIAVNEAGKLFSQATGSDSKKEKSRFLTFINQRLKTDTATLVYGCVQLIGSHKLDSIQSSFSKIRIREIERALHTTDSTSRIKVIVPNREAPENIGSRPVFELKYSVDE